ncbi:hypothetical protein VTJ04DRAFT_8904 [Mycothermus thermophilus]|uniref:uncharacterized protein n=1 Tax=Humicola insolens TaxID=85995 RepID=UPI003742D491
MKTRKTQQSRHPALAFCRLGIGGVSSQRAFPAKEPSTHQPTGIQKPSPTSHRHPVPQPFKAIAHSSTHVDNLLFSLSACLTSPPFLNHGSCCVLYL